MANNSDSGLKQALLWTPALAGIGMSGYRVWQGAKGGIAAEVATATPNFIKDQSRIARDTALSAGLTVQRNPINLLTQIQEIGQNRSWARGLTEEGSRVAVAEATRAALFQGNTMPATEINSLVKRLLNPAQTAYSGSTNIYDIAAQAVSQQGHQPTFLSIMRSYSSKGGFAPGMWLNDDDMFFLLSNKPTVAANKAFNPIQSTIYKKLEQIDPSIYFENDRLQFKHSVLVPGEPSSYKEIEHFARGESLDRFDQPAYIEHDIPRDDVPYKEVRKSISNVGVKSFTPYTSKAFGVPMAKVVFEMQNVGAIRMSISLDPFKFVHDNTLYATPSVIPGLPSQGMAAVNWSEYYLQQIQEKLIPDIQKQAAVPGLSKTGRRRLIQGIKAKFISDMTEHMRLAMPDGTAGQVALQRLRSENAYFVPALSESAIRSAQEAGTPIAIESEMQALIQRGIFPTGKGSEVISGHFLGFDPRRFHMYGSEFPIEREPLKFLREFVPTRESARQLQALNPIGSFGLTDALQELSSEGYSGARLSLRAALPDSVADAALRATGLEVDEILMPENVSKAMRYARRSTVDIALDAPIGQGQGLGQWLLDQMSGGKSSGQKVPDSYKLIAGQQIGYEPGTGRTVTAANLDNIEQRILGARLIETDAGQVARLTLEDVHGGGDWIKTYGDLKMTSRSRNKKYLQHVTNQVGLKISDDMHGFIYFDQIRKNRSTLRRQMATAIAQMSQEQMRNSRVPLGRVNDMWDFFTKSASDIEKFFPDEIALLKQAKKLGLDLGEVGGGILHMGDTLPQSIVDEAIAVAGGREALIPKSGFIRGVFTQFAGDFRTTIGESTVDRMVPGTLEPRFYQQLLQQNWQVNGANVAPMVAGELLRLSKNYGPDITAVENMLRTMSGETLTGLETIPLPAQGFSGDIPLGEKAYLLDLGVPVKQMNNGSKLYIPGKEEMRRFLQFRDASGQLQGSEISNAYNRLMRSAVEVRSGIDADNARMFMDESANELQKAVYKEYGYSVVGRGSGSGVQGQLRTITRGSGMLPISSVDKIIQNVSEGASIISEKAGLEAFASLEAGASTTEELSFVQSQRKAFIEGRAVAGMVWRHPGIGPASMQPTMFVRGLDAASKSDYYLRMHSGNPFEIMLNGQTMAKSANIGPLIGLAADMDGDRAIAQFLGSQKTAKAVEDMLRGGNYLNQYQRFAVETTALAKSFKNRTSGQSTDSIDDIARLISGASKLRITKGETGSLSYALNQAKLAMAEYAPGLSNDFSMISELLEQHATISGSKGGSKATAGMGSQIAQAIYNLNKPGDVARAQLGSYITDMFGDSVTKGMDISARDIATGKVETWHKRIDIDGMLATLQDAMRQGNTQDGVLTHYKRMVQSASIDSEHGVRDILDRIQAAKAGKADVLTNMGVSTTSAGNALEGTGAQLAAKETDDILSNIKKMAKTKGAQWGKPALFGVMATTAAVMLLGAPKGQQILPPPRPASGDVHGIIPSGQIMGGYTSGQRDLSPENIAVPSGRTGGLSAPGMGSPRAYDSAASPLNQRIQMQIDADGANSGIINSNIGMFGPAKVSYSDNRSKMTAYDVEQMMERP